MDICYCTTLYKHVLMHHTVWTYCTTHCVDMCHCTMLCGHVPLYHAVWTCATVPCCVDMCHCTTLCGHVPLYHALWTCATVPRCVDMCDRQYFISVLLCRSLKKQIWMKMESCPTPNMNTSYPSLQTLSGEPLVVHVP